MSEGGRRVFGVRDFFCRSKKKSTNGGVEEDDGSGGWGVSYFAFVADFSFCRVFNLIFFRSCILFVSFFLSNG